MKLLLIFPFLGLAFASIGHAAELAPPVTYEDGRLSYGIVSGSFEEDGTFSIHDAESKDALLSKARFGLPRGKRGKIVKMVAEDIEDALGVGIRVVLEVADFNELGYAGNVRGCVHGIGNARGKGPHGRRHASLPMDDLPGFRKLAGSQIDGRRNGEARSEGFGVANKERPCGQNE